MSSVEQSKQKLASRSYQRKKISIEGEVSGFGCSCVLGKQEGGGGNIVGDGSMTRQWGEGGSRIGEVL